MIHEKLSIFIAHTFDKVINQHQLIKLIIANQNETEQKNNKSYFHMSIKQSSQ